MHMLFAWIGFLKAGAEPIPQSVQEQTIANKKRLEERDPAARRAKFDELRSIAEDPKKHKEFLLRTSLIASVRKAQGID